MPVRPPSNILVGLLAKKHRTADTSVDAAQGYVLVTGRAHPGLVEAVAAASDLVGGPVFTAVGGFHLMSHSTEQVDRVVHELRELGVERCGPAHCTGELAAARMKAALADGFIKMSVSSSINF